jgi:hypothetical protein
MSLRAFHLFFIGLSVVLTAFFAAWATTQYRADHDIAYAIAAVASVAVGGGLIAYGAAFQKKTRHLLVVLVLLAAPRAAWACPVCFGQNDSPMASAANLSILAMLIVTGGVLAAFASFFVYLMRRARMVAEGPAEAEADVRNARGGTQEGTVQC